MVDIPEGSVEQRNYLSYLLHLSDGDWREVNDPASRTALKEAMFDPTMINATVNTEYLTGAFRSMEGCDA